MPAIRSSEDLHNNVKIITVLPPAAVGTTGTGRTSPAIDRRGYRGAEFAVSYGVVSSVTAVCALTVFECDTFGGSYTSVADQDLLGTELAAGLPAANPRVSGVSQTVTKMIGYKGTKPFLKARVNSTATAAALVGVVAILHNPLIKPTV